jgi:hypothetical protein
MKPVFILLLISQLYASDEKAPSQRTRDRDVDIHHIKIDVSVNIKSGRPPVSLFVMCRLK